VPNYKRSGIQPPDIDLRGRISRIYTNSDGDIVFEFATGGRTVIRGTGTTPTSNILDGGNATATNTNDIDGGNATAINVNDYNGGDSNYNVIFPP
jgi:hypothetical protein